MVYFSFKLTIFTLQALDFPQVDLSVRLVEWLEVIKALGGEGVSFYLMQAHPNMTKGKM